MIQFIHIIQPFSDSFPVGYCKVLNMCIPLYISLHCTRGFLGGSNGKDAACSVGHLGSFPGSGRSPGKGDGNPLQYSCLENPMDRGTLWSTVHVVAKSQQVLAG